MSRHLPNWASNIYWNEFFMKGKGITLASLPLKECLTYDSRTWDCMRSQKVAEYMGWA